MGIFKESPGLRHFKIIERTFKEKEMGSAVAIWEKQGKTNGSIFVKDCIELIRTNTYAFLFHFTKVPKVEIFYFVVFMNE